MTLRQPPKVLCLRGRIREFGPSLEHAPEDHIYIGRRFTMGGWKLPQSIWANPYTIAKAGDAETAVALYDGWLLKPAQAWLRERLPEIAECTLLCWCAAGKPCHGNLLSFYSRYGHPDTWPEDGFSGLTINRRHIETITTTGAWAGAL
jgi:Domain of unknown function (DUF4326)